VNVALEGVRPVMMGEGDSTTGIGHGESIRGAAEVARKCPLPSSRTVTTTTDTVVKMSWVPANHVFASGAAGKAGKRLRKKEKQKARAELSRAMENENGMLFGRPSGSGPLKTISDDRLVDEQKMKFAERKPGCQERAEVKDR
jgi:hypothetical protein